MIAGACARGAVCVVLACAIAVPAASQHAASPLFGALTPGGHRVGFTILQIADSTRPSRATRDANGSLTAADRARKIAVHVWYPASPAPAGKAMVFGDYMKAHLPGASAEELRRRDEQVRGFLSQFGAISDDRWIALKSTSLLARLNAPSTRERFPLVIGALRPLSTTITNEYLASHGYVVAMVDGEDGTHEPADAGPGLDVAVRDMEFAIAELRHRPDVDQKALATLGFSGAGFSQILLAMRHPDVEAVCNLESAIFDDRMMWPLSRGWGYSLEALRVPFLHTYGVPLSARENRIGDFEGMRYSTRYRYLVDAPGLHHWDFATEGMAASTVLGLRGDAAPRLRQAFETTNRYVLAFFDAHVKRDPRALAFMRADPVANGVPAGLITIRELNAIEPAPTREALTALMAERGLDAAMKVFDEARARDPQAALFREDQLNSLGYRLLRSEKTIEATTILRKVVELYPASVNAYDSLGEALEEAGERAQAVEVTRKGLEVAARTGAQGPVELLRDRLKRLTSGS